MGSIALQLTKSLFQQKKGGYCYNGLFLLANPILHHAFHTKSPHPSPRQSKFIEIGFSWHSVTTFELLKYEDKYTTYNNKSSKKQGICEMIPVLSKVIPLRSSRFKIYCCFISKTLVQAHMLDPRLKPDNWEKISQIDWQHSSGQISVAGKQSIHRMVKIFWPIRCMLLKLKFLG